MSFYRFHAATGVPAASFLYEQVNARPGHYLPFLEHVARRQERRRSRVRVRVRPREIPVLKPAAVNALIVAEARLDPMQSHRWLLRCVSSRSSGGKARQVRQACLRKPF